MPSKLVWFHCVGEPVPLAVGDTALSHLVVIREALGQCCEA